MEEEGNIAKVLEFQDKRCTGGLLEIIFQRDSKFCAITAIRPKVTTANVPIKSLMLKKMENKNNTTETTKVEEQVDATVTEETAEVVETTETEESTETEAEKQNVEIDYDAEIEKERKGKPDPKKAFEAKRERHQKVEEKETEEDDKPITRKDLAEIEAKVRRDLQAEQALTIAKGFASSEKEAELIVEKWKNRTFPATLTLSEQIEEAFAITHRKKLIGERNEALRALRGKEGVNKDSSGTHQDPKKSTSEPKLSSQDTQAIKASGFSYNSTARRFEKKLPNGVLVWDFKAKRTFLVRK